MCAIKNCSVFLFYCFVVLLTIRLQVLDCSALAPDLSLLPAGDKTQIGEQGVGFRSSSFFAISHHMIPNTKGYQSILNPFLFFTFPFHPCFITNHRLSFSAPRQGRHDVCPKKLHRQIFWLRILHWKIH